MAPWGGHCKELLPSYEKAAKNLKKRDTPLRLAKIDATAEVSADIAKKYGIAGYPTLIAFKDGVRHSNFDWAPLKEKQEIQAHMEAVAGNPSLFQVRIFYETLRS